ncbi:MAG TPA: hypothetical protein DCX67_01370 [Opitutae bacterium]|nr:hypothetical protein [Opitutae bacterium]
MKAARLPCLVSLLLGHALYSALPSFEISSIPDGKFAPLRKEISQYVDVFGIPVLATPRTPPEKVKHAAIVLAEYLDNDEDGEPDNPKVLATMVRRDAFLFMTRDERSLERFDFELFVENDLHHGQGQFGTETNPGNGEFDATLEEVLHLITHEGYAHAYPDVFGERPGTVLADCLDRARGGHFKRVPRQYPKVAWFTYDDRTCDYGCQCAEYLYWAITSVLGAQDSPKRIRDIRHEWKLYTRELVKKRDPWIFALITNPKYKLPARLPDGKYRWKKTRP